jgi:hypothetical protein
MIRTTACHHKVTLRSSWTNVTTPEVSHSQQAFTANVCIHRFSLHVCYSTRGTYYSLQWLLVTLRVFILWIYLLREHENRYSLHFILVVAHLKLYKVINNQYRVEGIINMVVVSEGYLWHAWSIYKLTSTRTHLPSALAHNNGGVSNQHQPYEESSAPRLHWYAI